MRWFSSLIGLLLSSTVQAQTLAPPPTPAVIPNFTLNGGLPHWKAALAKVRSGSADARIVIMSASLSTGHGSFFNATASDARSGSWAQQLKALWSLPQINIPVDTNTLTGDNLITPFSAYDNRVSGVWNELNAGLFVLGGGLFINADTTAFGFNPNNATAYPSITSNELSDHLDVYWTGTAAQTGNLTVNIGAELLCTINVNTASASFNKTTCNAPSLDYQNYSLSCSNATPSSCGIAGLDAGNSTQAQVKIFNGACDGCTLVQFASTADGFPWDPIPALSVYQPNLCIIGAIANDASAQTPLATYTAAINALIAGCKAVGADSVIFTGLPASADTSPITLEQYEAAAVAAANANGVPVWDSFATYGGNAGWITRVTQGWNAGCCGAGSDGTHDSIASNVYKASVFSQILLQ